MSTNNLYPGLPKVPASANLPKKPASPSTPLDSTTIPVSESPDVNKDLLRNAQSDRPAQHLNTSKPPASLPRLSSTTKDILARVQGPSRDANSVFSPSVAHQHAQGALSSTSNNSAAGSNLGVLHTASALPSFNTNKFYNETSNTTNDVYRESHKPLPNPQASTPLKLTSQSSGHLQPNSRESTINVGNTHHSYGSMTPPSNSTGTTQSSSRRQREYVLQDGTIVKSGKGLGRGRPGIKRGPRKPKLDPKSSTPLAPNLPSASSELSKKRKRSIVTADEARVNTRTSVSEDQDSDNYTPKATHTRSGRSTQKPSAFVPTESPAAQKIRLASGLLNAQGINLIKKKVYRGREQNALCERCLRGRGPADNAIVFCDGCNLCWHQKCHDPRIPKELVLDAKAEWFCKDCLSKLESTAIGATTTRAEAILGLETGDSVTVEAQNAAEVVPSSSEQSRPSGNTTGEAAVATASSSLVSARSLTVDQRQHYLTSLSRQQLVDLLLHVSYIAPNMPLFPAPRPQTTSVLVSNPLSRFTGPVRATIPTPLPLTAAGPSASPASTTNTMKPPPLPLPPPTPPPPTPLATSPNPNLNPSRAAKAAAPKYTSPSSPSSESAEDSEPGEDFEEEDYTPSHAKCYPKPGHGVMAMLPPDKADEHILLEGPESRTFSHSVARVLPVH